MNTAVRAPRPQTPERWAKAAARAIAEGVEVRQIASTGQWVATSGTDATVCYLIEVTLGPVVRTACSCAAGEFGDACCKHAARLLMDLGLLTPPEPPTPAAPAAPRTRALPQRVVGLNACWGCSGYGIIRDSFATPCTRCGGTGRDPELAAA